MNELILTVDTSSQTGSVALTEGETLLGEILLNVRATHSERLLTGARQLLTDTGKALEDLVALGIVQGPGSFTGLRVGMGTIQGLAMALRKPVVSVSALETLALNAAGCERTVWALMDARKNEVYAASYSLGNGFPVPLTAERVLPPHTLLPEMNDSCVLVGSGALAFRDLWRQSLGEQALLLPSVAHHPRAVCAALLAHQKYCTQGGQQPHQVRPVYIRPSDAELAKK